MSLPLVDDWDGFRDWVMNNPLEAADLLAEWRALADEADDLFDRIVEDLGLGEGYGAEVDAWQARHQKARQR